MYEGHLDADDPGTDLAAAAVSSMRSTLAVRSAADAVELQSIATLARVRRTQAVGRGRRGAGAAPAVRVDLDLVDRCTAQEVSIALRLSPVVARDRLETALELVERRPATFEALRTGQIDLLRARRIADAVRHLSSGLPSAVAGAADGPSDLSDLELDLDAADLDAADLDTAAQDTAADDAAADDAAADDAAADDDGLPAGEPPDAAALVEAEVLRPGSVPGLTDLRPAPAAGELTPAQLSARLTRLVLRADPAGSSSRTAAADARRGCTLRALPDGMALLSVTGRAELLTAAFSRIDLTARALVAAGSDVGPLPDARAAAGPRAAGGPRHGVDAARGLEQARVDVLLASLLGHSSDLASAPGVHVSLALVAPAGTVLAGSDEPGELTGYGPLPAPLVRELAADADWVRWSSDAVNGQVTAVDRRRYRPSASVAALVRARDQQCRFPTCRRAVRGCDLDHVVPFPLGPTVPANLAAECRLHHLCKHRAGFSVRMEPNGTVVWTTPTGGEVVDHPPSWGRPPPVRDEDHLTAVGDPVPEAPPPF